MKIAVSELIALDGLPNTKMGALAHIAGVTSSTELDRAGFEAMMGFFDYLGFKPI